MTTQKPPFIEASPYHFVGDGKGGWVQTPGRLQFSIVTKAFGPAEKGARDLVGSATRINGFMVDRLESLLAGYLQARENLYEYLHTPQGNIPIVADSAEFRNMWHLYLFKGRELIDATGPLVGRSFNLKYPAKGLNAESFSALRKVISQASRKAQGFEPLVECLERSELLLQQFIKLRNREKTHGDTIRESPAISEEGIPSKGKLYIHDPHYGSDFIIFFEQSHTAIMDLIRTILGSE
jgi:hypothetical protein